MKLRYLALAGLALPAAPALAQDAQPAANAQEIVVTGRGLDATPATPAYDVQQIDREDIVSTGSGRLEDALQDVAGFQQFRRSDSRSSNPSAQGVTLRALGGNATSRAQVLLDGVPMADPFFGYIPLSAIPPERLSNIVVTRGGGSSFMVEPDPSATLPGQPRLQGGLYDRVLLSVRTVGLQMNYDDGQQFADDVDGLLLADSNVVIGSQQALYVTRAGGPPVHMMTDSARRAHFVCSYVVPVARVASAV